MTISHYVLHTLGRVENGTLALIKLDQADYDVTNKNKEFCEVFISISIRTSCKFEIPYTSGKKFDSRTCQVQWFNSQLKFRVEPID